MKVAVVLLVWKRPENLKRTLNMLIRQSCRNFDVYISNGNLDKDVVDLVEKVCDSCREKGLGVSLSHDGNEIFTFRRFVVGKKLAEAGYDVVMYIDDDVTFTAQYIQNSLAQYEPKTYSSAYAWSFYRNGSSYYKHRTRVWDNETKIHYCGTGISMVDSSIFLQDGLFDAPEGAQKIEDLWLSFYAQHIAGWKLKYMDAKGIVLRGADDVALFKEVGQSEMNKAVFLRQLVKMGWDIPD